MPEFDPTTVAGLRELATDLQRLGAERAPSTLLPDVLARLGLADAYATVDSPIGLIFVAYSDEGVSAVERAGDATEFEARFRARFGRRARPTPALPAKLARAIAERWQGERRTVPKFDLRGLSEFERAVLMKALEIPRGEVRPYAWIAREIGRPGAVRAVGSALGRNPIPLLIPCHRVVRSDGRVGEYALGQPAKRAVLTSEGVDPEQLESLAERRVRYYGSDTTHIYCFPTCHCARRITERHRVAFGSAAAAEAAGYRACQVCRPVA